MSLNATTVRYRLPLFPLPVVLFPGAFMPLHIFEPRYRRMVARCLETDRRFGLVYHDPDLHGPFSVEAERIGCVAEIMEFKPLPDGRSLLMAHGRSRFQMEDGLESEEEYFEAVVSEVPDMLDASTDLAGRRMRTAERFSRALEGLGGEEDSSPEIDVSRDVSFQIAAAIRISPEWQQALLETGGEADRLDQIDRLLDSIVDATDG